MASRVERGRHIFLRRTEPDPWEHKYIQISSEMHVKLTHLLNELRGKRKRPVTVDEAIVYLCDLAACKPTKRPRPRLKGEINVPGKSKPAEVKVEVNFPASLVEVIDDFIKKRYTTRGPRPSFQSFARIWTASPK